MMLIETFSHFHSPPLFLEPRHIHQLCPSPPFHEISLETSQTLPVSNGQRGRGYQYCPARNAAVKCSVFASAAQLLHEDCHPLQGGQKADTHFDCSSSHIYLVTGQTVPMNAKWRHGAARLLRRARAQTPMNTSVQAQAHRHTGKHIDRCSPVCPRTGTCTAIHTTSNQRLTISKRAHACLHAQKSSEPSIPPPTLLGALPCRQV